jgi:LPXTG-motif cell wall-anchored protein
MTGANVAGLNVTGLLAAVAVAITSVVMFGASPAQACSCAAGTTKEYAERAELVFVGSIIQTEGGSKARFVSYGVKVDRVFKGDVSSETRVITAAMSSTCGLPNLPEGEPLLFFASPGAAGVSVNSCGGTGEARPGNLKAVTAALGEPHEPSRVVDERDDMRGNSDPGPDLWPWPAAAGAGLLALGGGVLLRKRRSAV